MVNTLRILVPLFCCLALAGCGSPQEHSRGAQDFAGTEEAKIRAVQLSYAEAFATGNVDLCVESVFLGGLHALDPNEAARLSCSEWLHSGEQHGIVSIDNISIQGDRATATVTYNTSNTEIRKTTSHYIRDDSTWKIAIQHR